MYHRFKNGPTTKMVPVSLIDGAHYNPRNRSDPMQAHIRKLAREMAESGLINPVCIQAKKNGRFTIIDGHRRVAAAKYLGWLVIMCLIYENVGATTYAVLNDNQKPLSPAEKLAVYEQEEMAVPKSCRDKYDVMTGVVGEDTLGRTTELGFGYSTYLQAKRVAKYCGLAEDKAFIKSALHWLMETNSTAFARRAMDTGIDRAELLTAVYQHA